MLHLYPHGLTVKMVGFDPTDPVSTTGGGVATVMELVYIQDLKSCDRNIIRVQISSVAF